MPAKTSGIKIPVREELLLKQPKWSRIEKMLTHDEAALKGSTFCLKLPDESQAAYSERQEYFATNYINNAQDLVSAPGQTLFKNGYRMEFGSANSMLAQFAENCTLTNDQFPLQRYMRDHIAVGLRGYGTTFTVIDKPAVEVKNKLEERAKGMPYLINIRPLDVLNYGLFQGNLIWFAYRRKIADRWDDPTLDVPATQEVTCVWTPSEYFMVNTDGAVTGDIIKHNWGFVPVVIQATFLPEPDAVLGEWAFDQTSNMLITANNLNHIAVYELFKHGNSLLLLHEESTTAANMSADKAGNSTLKKQAKGRVLTWAGEKEPSYLVKELAVEECRDMAELYFKAAIENERDLKSVAKKGTDGEAVQESGFAKMLDREPLEGNLESLADDMESWFEKTTDIVARMLAVENDATLEFDRNFDLRSYAQKLDEIKVAIDNRMGEVSSTAMTETWKGITPEITSDEETQKKINKEFEANVPAVFGEQRIARDEAFGGFGAPGSGEFGASTSPQGAIGGIETE